MSEYEWLYPYSLTSSILHLQLAFKYLSWALFPLLGGYAVYSLLYLEQKGWYSWVLSLLYGFLLTFGELLILVIVHTLKITWSHSFQSSSLSWLYQF